MSNTLGGKTLRPHHPAYNISKVATPLEAYNVTLFYHIVYTCAPPPPFATYKSDMSNAKRDDMKYAISVRALFYALHMF